MTCRRTRTCWPTCAAAGSWYRTWTRPCATSHSPRSPHRLDRTGSDDDVTGVAQRGFDLEAVLWPARLQGQHDVGLTECERTGNPGVLDVQDVRAEFADAREHAGKRAGAVRHAQA